MNSFVEKKYFAKHLDKLFVCLLCHKGYKSQMWWNIHIHEKHGGHLNDEDFLDISKLALNNVNSENISDRNSNNKKKTTFNIPKDNFKVDELKKELKGILKNSGKIVSSHEREQLQPEKLNKQSGSKKADHSDSISSQASQLESQNESDDETRNFCTENEKKPSRKQEPELKESKRSQSRKLDESQNEPFRARSNFFAKDDNNETRPKRYQSRKLEETESETDEECFEVIFF